MHNEFKARQNGVGGARLADLQSARLTGAPEPARQ